MVNLCPKEGNDPGDGKACVANHCLTNAVCARACIRADASAGAGAGAGVGRGREGPGGREGGLKNSGGWMLMLRVKPCQHEVAADYSREEKIIESTAILKSTS